MAFNVGSLEAEAKKRLRTAFRTRLEDPASVEMVRRSLAAEVVMDTWLAGRREERNVSSILRHLPEIFTVLFSRSPGSALAG